MHDEDSPIGSRDDPRLPADAYRHVESHRYGDVTLVGVVHDHPAAVYRTQETIRALAPDVVALELPPTALPLYREYAADGGSPPAFGGEMSAAIDAAEDATVVGIDGPSVGFLRSLGAELVREGSSLGVVRDVVADIRELGRHALTCRAAAAVAATTGLRVEVDDPVSHDVDRTAPADRQAESEATHLARSRSLLRAVELPAPMARLDAARERHMASGLRDRRTQGDVVAVVGYDHLDAVADALV
jgi:pheromone shutdown protein TraB